MHCQRPSVPRADSICLMHTSQHSHTQVSQGTRISCQRQNIDCERNILFFLGQHRKTSRRRISETNATSQPALPEISDDLPRIAVFVSGGGSNFRAIHSAILNGSIKGEISVRCSQTLGKAEYCVYRLTCLLGQFSWHQDRNHNQVASYWWDGMSCLRPTVCDSCLMLHILVSCRKLKKFVTAVGPSHETYKHSILKMIGIDWYGVSRNHKSSHLHSSLSWISSQKIVHSVQCLLA